MTIAEIDRLSTSITHQALADLNQALGADLPTGMLVQLSLKLRIGDRDPGESAVWLVVRGDSSGHLPRGDAAISG